MYNPENQYRCTIIRGKSQKDIEDFLPAYAQIINEICPCEESIFENEFNKKLSGLIPPNSPQKTFNNHRTEIAGKLFGMYYKVHSDYNDDIYVYPGERTIKYLKDQDQPAFFKDICYKMQFPNGMTKFETVKERLGLGISIRPCCYIVEVLIEASRHDIVLTRNDIGYYVLNALDALKRIASPYEIVETIVKDRNKGITSHVIGNPEKASSYNVQHINEQLNYMELANLIVLHNDGTVRLNEREIVTINLFASHWDDDPAFNVAEYDLNSVQAREFFEFAWGQYYSALSADAASFETSLSALISDNDHSNDTQTEQEDDNTVELGDEGEKYVYEYEKKRVSEFSARLANKVLAMGKTRGLGYDIQTVMAIPGDKAEYVKYIEVKATKRITAPDINDSLWLDTINMTRNEWVAAQQHGDYYSIYRVYFVRGNVLMYIIENPYKLYEKGTLSITPTTYKMDFGNDAIDRVISKVDK
ncbi:protein NO VEIN domain-containing protein [Aristaeella lactis]|uniref:Uncharacterized protein n=1 Tax=Aristaeella lactis TaxID=3046383 RepID=A0AC61PLG2_9FIRM|nr:DUF3883 domain-containing protein [Aristaeella lactis]QUA52191.1 DUF3883 domain-containing protein [Aristaeella lactis]SMC58628.1 protein of unknown function [Aristaeella lactis]